MRNRIQLWGFGLSYRTSVVAPVVATIVAVLVLVAAAIVVLGFIAALLLAALVLRFIAVTNTAAAAVAASALVIAALDTATGLEVQVDAPGAAGVVVEGVARELQSLLCHIAILVLALKRPSASTASTSTIPCSKTQSRGITSSKAPSPSTHSHRASRCDTKETSASVATATPELAQGTAACIFRSGEDTLGLTCTCRGQKKVAGRVNSNSN